MEIERFTTADAPAGRLDEVRALLGAAFGANFTDDDWAHALGGWHVLAVERDAVLAHAAVVPRRLEVAGRPVRTGYVEAVATQPARQREGLGSQVMREARQIVEDAFELGALATSTHGFYTRLGWERWRGPTYVREGARLVRSPDEDGAVMVLRTGATRGLDLAAPIACETRRGDAW